VAHARTGPAHFHARLDHPEFGDSGVDEAGQALPGDQGLYLDQGRYHYYAFVVPTNNLGLVRVALEAISGNPDLFARVGEPPTDSHGSTGGGWTDLIQRALVDNTGTEYGNWVPGDGRYEAQLSPGAWYVAVRAVGGQRATASISAGTVQDLTLNGGQSRPGPRMGDWRYYRVNYRWLPRTNGMSPSPNGRRSGSSSATCSRPDAVSTATSPITTGQRR
jgi:hypothetical protein